MNKYFTPEPLTILSSVFRTWVQGDEKSLPLVFGVSTDQKLNLIEQSISNYKEEIDLKICANTKRHKRVLFSILHCLQNSCDREEYKLKKELSKILEQAEVELSENAKNHEKKIPEKKTTIDAHSLSPWNIQSLKKISITQQKGNDRIYISHLQQQKNTFFDSIDEKNNKVVKRTAKITLKFFEKILSKKTVICIDFFLWFKENNSMKTSENDLNYKLEWKVLLELIEIVSLSTKITTPTFSSKIKFVVLTEFKVANQLSEEYLSTLNFQDDPFISKLLPLFNAIEPPMAFKNEDEPIQVALIILGNESHHDGFLEKSISFKKRTKFNRVYPKKLEHYFSNLEKELTLKSVPKPETLKKESQDFVNDFILAFDEQNIDLIERLIYENFNKNIIDKIINHPKGNILSLRLVNHFLNLKFSVNRSDLMSETFNTNSPISNFKSKNPYKNNIAVNLAQIVHQLIERSPEKHIPCNSLLERSLDFIFYGNIYEKIQGGKLMVRILENNQFFLASLLKLHWVRTLPEMLKKANYLSIFPTMFLKERVDLYFIVSMLLTLISRVLGLTSQEQKIKIFNAINQSTQENILLLSMHQLYNFHRQIEQKYIHEISIPDCLTFNDITSLDESLFSIIMFTKIENDYNNSEKDYNKSEDFKTFLESLVCTDVCTRKNISRSREAALGILCDGKKKEDFLVCSKFWKKYY